MMTILPTLLMLIDTLTIKVDVESFPLDTTTATIENVQHALFDLRSGEICNLAGKNQRNKSFAVSKNPMNIDTTRIAERMYLKALEARSVAQPTDVICFELSCENECARMAANAMCLPVSVRNTDGKVRAKVEQDHAVLDSDTELEKTNLLVLGDSYSEQGRWIRALQAIIPGLNVVNLGKSSATLCDVGTNNIRTQINRLDEVEEKHFDRIVIEGGHNDLNNYDFNAAITWQVDTLRKMFPDARIYYTTPCGLYYGHTDTPLDFMIKAEKIRQSIAEINSATQTDAKDKSAMSAAENRHLIETIDWDKTGGISFVFNNCANETTEMREDGKPADGTAEHPYHYNVATEETVDLLHPNELGALKLARTVALKFLGEKESK